VKKAVVKYRELTAEERTRDIYERREKARRDQAMHQKWALKKNMIDVARKLLELSMPTAQIISVTGLTLEEVDGLREKMTL